MGFREDGNRGGGFRGNRSGGGRSGGFNRGGSRGGFRDRDSGGFGDRERRRPLEMHDVICDKCGKECQVPFKPSGDKPVLCSDCYRKEGDSSSGPRKTFESRNDSAQSGISKEQFNELNTKLDKILGILEMIEFEEEDGEEESEDEEAEEAKSPAEK